MLRTNRGLAKFFFLSILTFGIYGLVVLCHISEEINQVASRRDGKQTMHYALIFFLLNAVTLGIAQIVWYHKLSNRMGEELMARGIAYSFDAGTYWGWNIFGALILVGPFIYFYKFFKSMNLINAAYNKEHGVLAV
jgi:hypothetical protein